MGYKIGRLCGVADSDVTTYLTNPDFFAFKSERGYPESKMIALMNGTSCLLKCDVLLSTKKVQRAYR